MAAPVRFLPSYGTSTEVGTVASPTDASTWRHSSSTIRRREGRLRLLIAVTITACSAPNIAAAASSGSTPRGSSPRRCALPK
ncbi:MAG TPA: hypothetical protein VNT03_18485 [Baekduia sp.]|nr:hypothetical protein [Baekduia sp.]